MEIINEEFTKMTEFFVIGFTDFNPHPEIKNDMVVPFMLSICLLIFGNFTYLVF